MAQKVWRGGFGEVAGLVTGCFPRRETRQTFAEMTEAMLVAGWSGSDAGRLAEVPGRSAQHRPQHFPARAVRDHDAVRDRTARWAAPHPADEAAGGRDGTGSEESPQGRGCRTPVLRRVGRHRPGAGRCQAAAHLTCASRPGYAPVDREWYLDLSCPVLCLDRTADDERREPTGVPDELPCRCLQRDRPARHRQTLAQAMQKQLPASAMQAGPLPVTSNSPMSTPCRSAWVQNTRVICPAEQAAFPQEICLMDGGR